MDATPVNRLRLHTLYQVVILVIIVRPRKRVGVGWVKGLDTQWHCVTSFKPVDLSSVTISKYGPHLHKVPSCPLEIRQHGVTGPAAS